MRTFACSHSRLRRIQSRFHHKVGDKDTIRLLLKRYGDRMEEAAKDKTTKFMAALTTAQDCYIELTWDVHSWVPLLSRVLPRDHMRLVKRRQLILPRRSASLRTLMGRSRTRH